MLSILSENTEKLEISSVLKKENKIFILHSGKINRQVLSYVVNNTKCSFKEIEKVFTFDFSLAERGKNFIQINGTTLIR